jgi:DMSO/TMAO reductase YedYZ molybdopterin-dependent catalytic subunit
MRPQKTPEIWIAALAGLLLTAPAIALFYVARSLFGLSFVPFKIFDWISRALPGPVITFGIDSMVRLIRWLRLGDTASAAKTAEQAMAIAAYLVAGAVAAALFAVATHIWRGRTLAAGIGLGGVAAAVTLLIIGSLDQLPKAHPLFDQLWILSVYLVWGAALGWSCERLSGAAAPQEGDEIQRVEVERIDRRRFLVRLGGATAAITVIGAIVGARGSRPGRAVPPRRRQPNSHLPNANATVTPAPGTRPEYTPLEEHYRIDISTTPPAIDEASWRLQISGMVEHPSELTLEEIRNYEPLEQFITLSCISNPVAGDLIGTTRWTGVSLKRMLKNLNLKSNATHLKIRSADGFYETISLDAINSDDRIMLTYAWDGVPLLTEHGFPLRIYIPDRHGMKQPKWIVSIEATDHLEDGYWVTRGWDREAHMKATSVIDTVAMNMMIGQATRETLVPVGGIAHAGARGISKVEVRVDDGEWREAQLRSPLSGLTWVIWRYNWPFQKGKHTLTVRCFEGDGRPQIVEEAPPHPSGASGLHSKSSML